MKVSLPLARYPFSSWGARLLPLSPLVCVLSLWPNSADAQLYIDSVKLHQDVEGVAGTSEEGDRFGWSVAVGDFDRDGYQDLVVGVPYEDDENTGLPGIVLEDVGAIQVFYGDAEGLDLASDQYFRLEDVPGLDDEVGQRFGYSLAVGDFDGDTYDDVAVSAIGYSAGGNDNSGAVLFLFGSASGLSTSGAQLLSRATPGVIGEPVANEYFGTELAAGNLNGDLYDDLVVGIPNQRFELENGVGAIQVFYGSTDGPAVTGGQILDQGDIAGLANEFGDSFGSSLFVGPFDADMYDDVAVGIPREDIGNVDAGAAVVLLGSAGGLSTAGALVFHQGVTGVPGVPEEYDQFGFAVHGAHLDGFSNPMSLLVGAVGEDGGNLLGGPGVLHVFPSSAGGPLAAGQIIRQDTVDTTEDREQERFGYAIAAADLDHDGSEDVIVAAPFESYGDPSVAHTGRVHVFYGHEGLLATDRTRSFDATDPLLLETPEDYDWLGQALTVGDFNNDGSPDPVFAASAEDRAFFGSAQDSGVVHVLFAAPPGTIFLDGFESGTVGAWSAASP